MNPPNPASIVPIGVLIFYGTCFVIIGVSIIRDEPKSPLLVNANVVESAKDFAKLGVLWVLCGLLWASCVFP